VREVGERGGKNVAGWGFRTHVSQAVFMRVVTEITDVESGALDEAIFLVPAGYTERQVPGGGSFRP
jgi:hypothetical protein